MVIDNFHFAFHSCVPRDALKGKKRDYSSGFLCSSSPPVHQPRLQASASSDNGRSIAAPGRKSFEIIILKCMHRDTHAVRSRWIQGLMRIMGAELRRPNCVFLLKECVRQMWS